MGAPISIRFRIILKCPKRNFVYFDDVVEANIYTVNLPKGILKLALETLEFLKIF